MKNIKFTIISVSYNCAKDVKRTIDSLEKQTYSNYQYVLIDGQSTDDTIQIIQENTSKFKDYVFISEKDNGIYDAMNKGINFATGDYVFFLNMGDVFYNENVLKNIEKYLRYVNDPIIAYGNFYYGSQHIIYPDKIPETFFLQEKMICHQALFTHVDILKKDKFNTEYRVCADRDWIIRCYKKGIQIRHANIDTVLFDTNGLSSQYEAFALESMAITKKYYGMLGTIFVNFKRLLGRFKH